MPPVAGRRAADAALADALAACATLASRLAALPEAPDRPARRQALLALSAHVQAAGAALARLSVVGPEESPADAAGDPLAGFVDRPRLDAASAAFAERYPDTPLTLIVADVDHLHHVNDGWSSATGDAVLRAVADVLRAQSRPQDVLVHAGADLFVVALGGPVSTTRALLVAERLRAAIETHDWASLGDGLHVTASLGIAARAPGEPLDDALDRAGAALQECKRSGRNQVRARG